MSFPALGREALRSLGSQNQVKVLAGSFRVYGGILRNDTAVILHLHGQSIVRQNLFAELKDFSEALGSEPMFCVFPNVSLQQDRLAFAKHTAAIDEVLSHVPNFRDVCMRDEIAIRQDKPRKRSRMLLNS